MMKRTRTCQESVHVMKRTRTCQKSVHAYTYVSGVSARDEAYTYVSGVSARVSLCVVSVLNTSVHFYVGSVVSRNVHLLERDVSGQFCS